MELVHFNNAKKSLALATKVDEVKDIRDKAEALRLYARQSGETLEMQNQCAEIKLRAERRAGEILREQENQKPGEHWKKKRSHDATVTPKLSDLGITKSQSSRWQESAEVPEDIFEKHIAETKDRKRELTSTGVNRIAKRLKREKARQENAEIVESNTCEKPKLNHYHTIVVDPPWDISEMGDNEPFARSEPTYKSMTVQQIIDENIDQYSADDCHLYLWAINRMIFKAEQVIKSWGFRYVTLLTWCKPKIGMGNYFRNNTEHILFCVKGKQELLRHDVGTWFSAERGMGGHSSKPDEFYSLIESCSPGPRLDYFARNERKGWDVYGGEL